MHALSLSIWSTALVLSIVLLVLLLSARRILGGPSQ
jgi:hypothetical protein